MDIGGLLLRLIQTAIVAGVAGIAETIAARNFVPFLFRHGLRVATTHMPLARLPPGTIPREIHAPTTTFRFVGPQEAFFQPNRDSRRQFAPIKLRGRIRWEGSHASIEQRMELGAPIFLACSSGAMGIFGLMLIGLGEPLELVLTAAVALMVPVGCFWGLRVEMRRMVESVDELKPFLSRQAV